MTNWPLAIPAPKKKKDTYKEVTVRIKPGQQVITKTTPKSEDIDRPFFSRWAEKCRTIPSDTWAMPQKHHPKCKRITTFCACPKNEIKIADMHTMQLVNAIKWCIRTATSYLSNNGFSNLGVSRAQALAIVPQWGELLREAKKRELKIVEHVSAENSWDQEEHHAKWFEDAMLAIGMRALEGKKKPGEL